MNNHLKCLLLVGLCLQRIMIYSQPIPFNQKYVDSITPLLSTLPNDTNKVNILSKLASMLVLRNPQLTLNYANEGAAIAEKINYPTGKINCLGQSAFSLAISGEWAKSTININEAFPLAEKYDSEKLIYLYNIMFINSAAKGDNDLALEWANKALHHPAFSTSNDIEKWPTYMQLGRGYESRNMLDSAKYFSQILSGYIKKYAAIIPDLASNSYVIAGNIALKLKNYPEAIKNYRLANEDVGLAITYQQLNEQDSAVYYARKSLHRGYILKSPIIQPAAKLLATLFANSNPIESNKYLNIYIDSKDSLYSNEKLKQDEQIKLNEQKNLFEYEKRATANRNRILLWSLLFILLLLTIFSLVVWRNNRFKHKVNSRLKKAFQELKSTQSQLIQSEKMASLGELTAGIAHEIQNPLNFVNNFSEVSVELIDEIENELREGNKEEAIALAADIKQNLQKVTEHGKRADAIVKGMLQHSRANTGKKELTDINALADEYLRLSYHGMRAKDKSFNATIQTHFDKSIGKIEVIPQDIGRVLLNLFNNAFYSVAERKKQLGDEYEPTVSVSTKRLNVKIEIRVKDNGPGISLKVVDKIFQPFFTTKPTGQGTGLGLSLSYDIVKAHGGEIKVESKDGAGSELLIELPFKT